MGQFSDDGQFWWDGTTWVATSQIVLPQFPPTEFEQSGKLEIARSRWRTVGKLYAVNQFGFPVLTPVTGVPLLVLMQQALSFYRSWTLEQLALATAYLLGPEEPVLASELGWRNRGRDMAVAVTPAHVVVYRIDSSEGQPRWVALARRLDEVTIEYVRPFDWGRIREAYPVTEAIPFGPSLMISVGDGRWAIQGFWTVFKPKPVLEAWQRGRDSSPVDASS
ncbi:MAG TPA: hypothetical protein VGV88_10360 [Candidatus Dormibacteraeota bacterium]|nr:hypothetical protein [Candidatus Dormibacteraeota bacterium]